MTNNKIKVSDHESYNTFTILSILVPFVGFILGIVYLAKDETLDKKLGEHLIVASILISIAYGALWIFLFDPAYIGIYY